ncbi:MAG: RnfABCDGE type electron transport complex subunit D, partial [Thermoplasmata archaeon]|nr:RnfABCDGE type electron transport complex subunit D [Thermoplasmata archaeon]NIY02671.1 electron transporter RnfD [Thermoplasmata archaeon]
AEGVMFAILIGNMFTPLLDRLTLPKGLKGVPVEG